MTTMLTIAGIAIASEFIGNLMEHFGHSNKVVFVKIAAYISCGYIAMDFWWDGVRTVAGQFGVHI
ncbi:hypothetical protein [Paenibacillus silvisoli]|uniref:hypothetical protein n=1 Tax=Paenibacillus silvisoli TaxID=3110539 RepID=UPI0028057B60|nr:hypothetical protein [Paenibacillus silvisoli]